MNSDREGFAARADVEMENLSKNWLQLLKSLRVSFLFLVLAFCLVFVFLLIHIDRDWARCFEL